MNTFHIRPIASDVLAQEVYEELKTMDMDLMVAIRGSVIDDNDYTQEYLYTISPCPNQDDQTGYTWTYVMVGDWLEEYNKLIG